MAVIEITAATTMEAILHAYPTAKVGLFQRYHVGGCDACSYRPNETLEDVRRNFNIKASIEEIVNIIRGSAEAFTSLHISPKDLVTALRSRDKLSLLDVRKPEEYQVGSLPGSKLVTVELTFEILDRWPKDAFLVFYSNHGGRSLDKASYFRAYGFPRARSLTGGLTAWHAEVGQETLPPPPG